jgi:hypothetical protein
MERLVQASSLPFLQFEYSDAERLTDGSFNTALLLEMDNAGAGAARVDWLRVTLNGKVVESWRTTLDALQRQMVASGELPAVVPLGAIIVGDFGAAFLKGGDKRQLLRWTRTDANAAFWDMGEQHLSNSKELVMQACYCSIFDQCWITSNRSFKPQSVESCSKEN